MRQKLKQMFFLPFLVAFQSLSNVRIFFDFVGGAGKCEILFFKLLIIPRTNVNQIAKGDENYPNDRNILPNDN